MKGTILTLMLLLVACAAALLWSGQAGEPTPTYAARTTAQVDDVDAADAAANHVKPTAIEAMTREEQLQRHAEQPTTARPFPDGATWIELTVVDRAGTPLAGAEIGWFRDEDRWRFESSEIDEARVLAWRQDEVLLAGEIGWQAVTGDDGKVRVALDGPTVIAGQRETLRGTVTLMQGALPPTGGYRLVLDDRDQFRVLVLTHDGAPVPGLPIGLFCGLPGETYFSYLGPGALAITDEQGRATIAGLSPHRTELAQLTPDRRQRHVLLRPFQPGFAQCAQPVDVTAPPEETVVLRLPPCGSVRARVDLGNANVTPPTAVSMSGAQEEGFDGWSSRLFDAAGFATFEHVPLGLTLHFDVPGWNGAEIERAGPRVADERLDVVLAPAPGLALIAGRLLTDEGPIAEQRVHFNVSSEHAHFSHQVETDANGRFSAPTQPVDDTGVLQLGEAQLTIYTDNQHRGTAQLNVTNLRVGMNDLGDLLLKPPELLGRGRLVVAGAAADAPPVRWPVAQIAVEIFDPQADPDSQWQHHGSTQVDRGSGTFELRGKPTASRLRLTVQSEGLLPGTPVEFRSGAEDLVVEVDRGFPLAASMLLPEGARAEMVTCRLEPQTPSPKSEDRLWTWPQHEQGQRYHLLWSSLPAGNYSLTISAAGGVVTKVPDITLPPPSDGDPRLVDLDLRPLLRMTTVRVAHADGEAYFAISVRDDANGTNTASYGYRAAELLLPRRPVQAVVAAEGCRPRDVRIDRDTVDVQLDEWQAMTLLLADVPPEAANLPLMIVLHGPDSEQVEQRMLQLGFEDGRSQLLSPTFASWHIENGRATVRIGDGPHQVHLSAYVDNQWVELDGVSPAVLQPTTAAVTLRVPPSQWQLVIPAKQPGK